MMLHDEALRAALAHDDLTRRLVVTPILDPIRQITPGSIDLRLGTSFIEMRRREARVIDAFAATTDSSSLEDRYEVPIGESLVLHPGQFVLGATFEFVRMPSHLAGQVLGRSSWGRLGLIVATAVTVQPGFSGCLTLELQNLGSVPIRLFPGLRIAQLSVWTTESPAAAPYSSLAKYDAPLGPEMSKIGWESSEVSRLQAIGMSLQGGHPTGPVP